MQDNMLLLIVVYVKEINGLIHIISENLGQLSSKGLVDAFSSKHPRHARVEISIILHFQIIKPILFTKMFLPVKGAQGDGPRAKLFIFLHFQTTRREKIQGC